MTDLPADVVKFLRENGPPAEAKENEPTCDQVAKVWGVTKTTARKYLDIMVKEGTMRTELRRAKNGQLAPVYFPTGKKKPGG